MNFDEPGTTKDPSDMLPDGEHVGKIIAASEEVMSTWEKTPTCIVLEIKADALLVAAIDLPPKRLAFVGPVAKCVALRAFHLDDLGAKVCQLKR